MDGLGSVLEEFKEYSNTYFIVSAPFLAEVAEWRIDGETDLCEGKSKDELNAAARCRTP